MPRVARKKDNNAINYILVKGLSDVHLFKEDEDKDEYINFIKKFKSIYGFNIYAYCIMNDYAHFLFNPNGADISSIMSSINIGYSLKYNCKYNRNGHLFNNRFNSKIIKDDLELKAFTLYIHNSPTILKNYKRHPENYKYSSFGSYIGLKDEFQIVDEDFIDSFIGNDIAARKNYMDLVQLYDTDKLLSEIEVYSKISNTKYYSKSSPAAINIEEILDFISAHTGVSKIRLQSKYIKDVEDIRAITAFTLKNFYHARTLEICSLMGGISSASASKLFLRGLKLIEENKEYGALVDDIRKKYVI